MPLNDDDVREILRLIDESDVEELRIETGELFLHVLRGPAAAAGAEAETSPDGPAAGELLTVDSPMIGTFYRAEAPGAAPFVDVGTRVEPHTTVCVIEVMKMMNSIRAGVVGTIVEVCAANSELVEYGAPLFRVRPDR